ncbi:hypothetical protein [Streptomyces herbicida]|uniref:hypothetical protein n=2 Tax=Streptomyces TaxID=1883 RepID=UPI00292CCC66|nr:hypothetical protein [Streptomyces sp. NEAU-HV9]
MNATTSGWDTLWQCRLRHILDDHFADLLSKHLDLRIRSFESLTERIMGLRTVALGDDFAFLSLEVDERRTPLVRLTGPTRQWEAARHAVDFLAEAVARAEDARYPGRSSTGLPLWVPYRAPEATAVTRFLSRGWHEAWPQLTWPAGLPVPRGEGATNTLACLGIIVDSLRDSVRAAIGAGGELLHPTSETDVLGYAVMADPAQHPLLLWQPGGDTGFGAIAPARLDLTTDRIDHMAEFYRRVAGWRTQVLPQDGQIDALLTHHDKAVGVLREDRAEKRTIAPLINHPRDTVWRAQRDLGLTVQSQPLWLLLGRQWRIRDLDGNELYLAERVQAARPPITYTPWSHLPEPFCTAFDTLESSLEILARVRLELSEQHPPPASEQADALIRVLADAVVPAAQAYGDHLRRSPLPGPMPEVLSVMRAIVAGTLLPLSATVRSLDDADLTAAFLVTCRLLVRAQLLPETINELQIQQISV